MLDYEVVNIHFRLEYDLGELIGVSKLREFFETLILTGRVKGEQPVSSMIIADPERGKTSVMVEKQCEAFKILTDLTGKGLQYLCEMDARCTHFVVNDMGIIMAHGQKTREYFFAMLLACTEEGIRAMAGPDGLDTIKAGRRGFVGCITSTQAKDQRQWWFKRGLARRMVPFHFDYTQELVLKIKAEIQKGNGAGFNGEIPFKIPQAHLAVKIPKEASEEIRRISDFRSKYLGQLGISLLKNYRILAQAHAIGRTWKNPTVNKDDLEFLKRIDPYVDWEKPGML
jgi:hypothetical protein